MGKDYLGSVAAGMIYTRIGELKLKRLAKTYEADLEKIGANNKYCKDPSIRSRLGWKKDLAAQQCDLSKKIGFWLRKHKQQKQTISFFGTHEYIRLLANEYIRIQFAVFPRFLGNLKQGAAT